MFVLALAALIVSLGLSLMLRAYWMGRYPEQAWSYRRRYQQLLARIDLAVTKVNSLANLVPHVKNTRVLDDYESCLRMLETLLSVLSRTPNFGFDTSQISQVQPLVNRVEKKVEDIFGKFKASIEARPLFTGLLERWQKETIPPAQGCYFCSRPYMQAYFKPATIKVDGINLRIIGCQICVAELKSLKKVKVLYFHDSGRPVHWSLVSSYKPSEQYWDLNRRRPSFQTPQIELLE